MAGFLAALLSAGIMLTGCGSGPAASSGLEETAVENTTVSQGAAFAGRRSRGYRCGNYRRGKYYCGSRERGGSRGGSLESVYGYKRSCGPGPVRPSAGG